MLAEMHDPPAIAGLLGALWMIAAGCDQRGVGHRRQRKEVLSTRGGLRSDGVGQSRGLCPVARGCGACAGGTLPVVRPGWSGPGAWTCFARNVATDFTTIP